METVEEPPINQYMDNWYEATNAQIDRGLDGEPIYDYTETEIQNPVVFMERSICASFWVYPNETLEAWLIRTSGMEDPERMVFSDDRHRNFIEHCRNSIKKGVRPDPIAMCKSVTEAEMRGMGGILYILDHQWKFVSFKTSLAHMDTLLASWRRTQFAMKTESIAKEVFDGKDIASAYAEFEQTSKSLMEPPRDSSIIGMDEILKVAEDMIEGTNSEEYLPMPSFPKLVSSSGGFPRGCITLVGAQPGGGKTALFMQLMQDVLLDEGRRYTVAAFLMESSLSQLMGRWTQRNGLIHGARIKNRLLSPIEKEVVHAISEEFANVRDNLLFCGTGSYSTMDMRQHIANWRQITGKKIDMIIVDYFTAMKHMPRFKGQSTYDTWQDSINDLKQIAAEENAVMILGSQITSDGLKVKPNEIPSIDIFKTKVVSEAAKVAVFLNKDNADMISSQQVVEQQMFVIKANDGGSGIIKSLFIKPFTKHVEDTQEARISLREHLLKLGFDIDTPRKDSPGDAVGRRTGKRGGIF